MVVNLLGVVQVFRDTKTDCVGTQYNVHLLSGAYRRLVPSRTSGKGCCESCVRGSFCELATTNALFYETDAVIEKMISSLDGGMLAQGRW